jgi:hypothetical protein
MRTYYDPEDDTCEKTDRYERLLDLADHLRDEAKDREMEESYNTFPASSDADETLPVAMLPADADTTLWGVGVSDAAGGYTFTDTADSIRPTTPEEDAAYKAEGEEIKADALAILATCEFMLTGYETQVCECAAGIDNGMKSVDMATFTTLRTQFSREISTHRNQ